MRELEKVRRPIQSHVWFESGKFYWELDGVINNEPGSLTFEFWIRGIVTDGKSEW